MLPLEATNSLGGGGGKQRELPLSSQAGGYSGGGGANREQQAKTCCATESAHQATTTTAGAANCSSENKQPPSDKSANQSGQFQSQEPNMNNNNNNNSGHSSYMQRQKAASGSGLGGGGGAKVRAAEKQHKLSVVIPSNQRNSLLTPTLVTASDGSGQQYGSLVYLNSQEVSLFTGLPSCTPTTADGLQLTSGLSQINPFFWNAANTGCSNENSDVNNNINNNNSSTFARSNQQLATNNTNDPISSDKSRASLQHQQHQQQQQSQNLVPSDTRSDTLTAASCARDQTAHSDMAARRRPESLSFDQQIQAAGAMMLSPLPFWLSPDALIRLGFANQTHPLASAAAAAAAAAAASNAANKDLATTTIDQQPPRADDPNGGAQDLTSPSQQLQQPAFHSAQAQDANGTRADYQFSNGLGYQMAKQQSLASMGQQESIQPSPQEEHHHQQQQHPQQMQMHPIQPHQAISGSRLVDLQPIASGHHLYSQQVPGQLRRPISRPAVSSQHHGPAPSIQLSLAPDLMVVQGKQNNQAMATGGAGLQSNPAAVAEKPCPMEQPQAASYGQHFIQMQGSRPFLVHQPMHLANYHPAAGVQHQYQAPASSQKVFMANNTNHPELAGLAETRQVEAGNLRLPYEPQLRQFYLASTRQQQAQGQPLQQAIQQIIPSQVSIQASQHQQNQYQAQYIKNNSTQAQQPAQVSVVGSQQQHQHQPQYNQLQTGQVHVISKHQSGVAPGEPDSGGPPTSGIERNLEPTTTTKSHPNLGERPQQLGYLIGPRSSLSRDTLSVDTNVLAQANRASNSTSSNCSRSSSATMLASDGSCSGAASEPATARADQQQQSSGWQASLNNQLMNNVGRSASAEDNPSSQTQLPVKKKSKGGRKKKQVTHEELMARKNRSKERNRVAAKRCRQKRKQFLDELRNKIDDLQNENSTLKSELNTLKQHHHTCRV